MVPGFSVMTVFAQGGREQAGDIAIQEKELDRHLRGDKGIVRADQIGEFAPPKRQRLLVQGPAEECRGQRASPASDRREALEPSERFITPKQFIAALTGKSDLEPRFGCK